MKQIYTLYLLLALVACKKVGEPTAGTVLLPVAWSNPIDSVRAGSPILLKFTGLDESTMASVYISNTFGAAVLSLEKEKNAWVCTIPQNFTRTAGPLHWKLVQHKEVKRFSSLTILPDGRLPPHVETYFGPRSITVGGRDYSMLVTIPTDPFDNRVLTGTEVTIKSEFQNDVQSFEKQTADFIAWKNIFSTNIAGRILVSASCLRTDTKELTTILFPANAEAFEIDYQRNHEYADGNQIISFQTNILKDRYGNKIGDGTLVTFLIKDSKGGYLKTTGMSIGGIAAASLLHPTEKEQWEVTAFITGAAKSNTISVAFEQAVVDFSTSFSTNNRTLVIGPLKSFMQQIIPDGIAVTVGIYDSQGVYLETKKGTAKNGICSFALQKEYFEKGWYRLEVKAAGILKKYEKELQ